MNSTGYVLRIGHIDQYNSLDSGHRSNGLKKIISANAGDAR